MSYILLQDANNKTYAILDVAAESWVYISNEKTTWHNDLKVLFEHIDNSYYPFSEDMQHIPTTSEYLKKLAEVKWIDFLCIFECSNYTDFANQYPEVFI